MNVVYRRQFAVLIFFAGVVFKIAFLPAYITEGIQNDNLLLILSYLIFDLALLALVFHIVKTRAIESLPKNFKSGIMLILFVFFAVKFAVMAGEAAFCVADNLFEESYLLFIIASICGLTGYIAVKGSGVLARLGEIFIVFTVICLVLNLITAESEVDFRYNFPLFRSDASEFFYTFDKFYMFTGDFLPLIVFTFKESEKKSKLPFIFAASAVLTVVGHYVFLNAIFKSGAAAADNLIVNLGAFNVGNVLIGKADALSLGVWFIMAAVNLSLTLLAATEVSSHFLRERRLGAAIAAAFAVFMCVFVFKNARALYEFTTGAVRYFMLTAEILVPVSVLAAYKIDKKNKKNGDENREFRMKNKGFKVYKIAKRGKI
ncbi:MAG: spore germination protein [Clostridiales bacterium]|jgi:hypothetical protein|nr:spore germination protein [Clostridiales bacterium]